MGLSREEQETIIRLGWGDDELTLCTTNPAHARHMERLGFEPDAVSCQDGEPVEWTFTAPADYFKLPKPKKRVSDKQRERMAALAAERFGKKDDDDDD